MHREWLVIQLREDWAPVPDGRRYPAGSLLAAPLEGWLAGDRELTVLFVPTPSTSLAGLTWTRHHLVLTVLDDVRTKVVVLTPPERPIAVPSWEASALPGLPELSTVTVGSVDRVESDAVWLVTTGFTTPTTLSVQEVGSGDLPDALKRAPAFFDAEGVLVAQHFAISDDGTRVPYFLVRGRGARTDGQAPTLLYGYGGFEISLLPSYSGALGPGLVVPGRGLRAGEHPWRRGVRPGVAPGGAARRATPRLSGLRGRGSRPRQQGVTTPAHLGVQGGSNGGLLTGNVLAQYPDLVGAVVIQVPLLDMRRYSHLLAGASWMAEYGDPDDPADWEFLRTYSPYHLLDADRDYPPVLLTTSTRDDRVHPGHARKVAAWLHDHGKDVTYYENVEGGHGGAADNAQASFMSALAYRFLAERLA